MIIRLWQKPATQKAPRERGPAWVIQLDERLSRAGRLLPQSLFLIGVSSDLIWEWNLSFCSCSRFVTAAGLVTAAECHRMQTTQSYDYRAALVSTGRATQREPEGLHKVVKPPAQKVVGWETDLYWHRAALSPAPHKEPPQVVESQNWFYLASSTGWIDSFPQSNCTNSSGQHSLHINNSSESQATTNVSKSAFLFICLTMSCGCTVIC